MKYTPDSKPLGFIQLKTYQSTEACDGWFNGSQVRYNRLVINANTSSNTCKPSTP